MTLKRPINPLSDPVFEQALTAATQAIAGNPELQLNNSNRLTEDPLSVGKTVFVSIANAEGPQAKAYLRGQCDLAALTQRHHNRTLHHRFRPRDSKAAKVYDALEQTRIESIGCESMMGLQTNLDHRMAIYCDLQGYARNSEGAEPPIADILAMLLREKITGSKPPESARNMVNLWRPWVEENGKDLFKQLRESIHNQSTYAQAVQKLLKKLELSAKTEKLQPEEQPEQQDTPPDEDTHHSDEEEAEYNAPTPKTGQSKEQESDKQHTRQQTHCDEDMDQEMDSDMPMHRAPNRPGITPFKQTAPYTIYTRDYDETIAADQLASSEELDSFRQLLDDKLKQYSNIHSQLATRLQRLLLAQQVREWDYDQEDGLIDNARLARLVVRPDMREIYKIERESDFRDSVVSLLIDNSGSMRGRPITIAALSADILARTLERCGVKIEILGFTTRDWKGGMARKHWESHAKKSNPGRLNDLRHIIYKPADMRLNKTRRNLGLMLKDGVLKENIDGEALLWAHERLLSRPEQRRILMVISDGAPVDDSTLSTNSSGYLDRHLREVIEMIETKSDVELLAIGIGHDVTRYYKRAVTIHEVDQLGDTMLKEMTKLFSEDEYYRRRA